MLVVVWIMLALFLMLAAANYVQIYALLIGTALLGRTLLDQHRIENNECTTMLVCSNDLKLV